MLGTLAKGVVTTSLFDDVDRDGKRGTGETPLADWPVALLAADGSEAARTTTDLEGVATAVVAPGTYELVPLRRPPAWRGRAPRPLADVVVARARAAATTSGWVQPGSVAVAVFHDLDKDGLREEGDLPLGDRTVKLISSTGTADRLHRRRRPRGLPGQGRDGVPGQRRAPERLAGHRSASAAPPRRPRRASRRPPTAPRRSWPSATTTPSTARRRRHRRRRRAARCSPAARWSRSRASPVPPCATRSTGRPRRPRAA